VGDVLVDAGALTREQLQNALLQQPRLGLPLGRVLLKLNYVTEEVMRQALSRQLHVPYVDLETVTIDRRLARLINGAYARRHALLPVSQIGDVLTVVMDDPTNTAVVTELERLTRLSITVITATSTAIERAFARVYGDEVDAPSIGSADRISVVEEGESTGAVSLVDEQQLKRADALLRELLGTAFERRASDIHLESLSSGLRVRYRVDGVLTQPNLGATGVTLDRSAREIISRIKILARLDIAERRRPQDGSFRVTVDLRGRKREIDLRVSVIPTYSGESVVVRVLDQQMGPRSLGDLGLLPPVAEAIDRLLRRPTGIFLVTGPTGSGKSTTLFSCLKRLQRPGVRILTAEDPVEYVYDEISQSEVNHAIGNSFASYLRAFLRHDPEVIMIGEIRDEETAEVAFRAAQTGHLLLSTLHTNSALAALPRLRDLEVESSLIGASLIGVLSQRLARRLCDTCRRETQSEPPLAREFFERVPSDLTFFEAPGCEACGFTGYRGRMLIADMWAPDEEDMLLVTREAPLAEVRQSAERTTFSMAQDASVRLAEGSTTVDELLRVMPYPAVAEHRERFGR
jgi:type IV pilus assembly protein PilB